MFVMFICLDHFLMENYTRIFIPAALLCLAMAHFNLRRKFVKMTKTAEEYKTTFWVSILCHQCSLGQIGRYYEDRCRREIELDV